MIPLLLKEIAAATGGTIQAPEGQPDGAFDPGQIVVDGPVVTDSRLAGPGGLYVARVGEHADGHDFVADAASRGAVAALSSRPVPELPAVVVDDVEIAFGRVARAVLDAADRPDRRRHHRLVGQDQHQGPAGPGHRRTRPDRRGRGVVQLRGRRATDRHPGRP